MKTCKRIEIVVEQSLARRVASLLDAAGAPGYTLIAGAGGRGDRGRMRADDPTGVASNCIFIIACNDDTVVSRLVEEIRPVLSRSGGICLVSDALWVRH